MYVPAEFVLSSLREDGGGVLIILDRKEYDVC